MADDRHTLESLPLAFQFAFSRDLGRDDPAYHVTSVGHGRFRASSPAGLAATLGTQGLEVQAGGHTWSLALNGWGRGGDLRPVPAARRPRALANHVELPRHPLTEWYVNGPLGLQVGWTLEAPPVGPTGQPLTLALSQGGSLRGQALPGATGEPGSRGLALAGRTGTVHWHWRGLMAYDSVGQELPAWLETRGDEVLVRVDDAGATYPVTIDPWVQASKLTTSTGLQGDRFGSGVALSADGSTMVASAPYHPFGAASGWHKGAVYVYTRPEGGWVSTPLYRAKLVASDGETEEYMGRSLVVSDDGSTVVVGAPSHATYQGAAYVFVRPPGGWMDATETAKITAGDGATHDYFGRSVSISGDGQIVAVGVPGHSVGGVRRGAVYVYERPASGWVNTDLFRAKLTNSDVGASDQFAHLVSVSGGGHTIVASAQYVPAGGTGRGAVYVYERPPEGWQNTAAYAAKLTASDGADDDRLGSALAVSAEGNVVVAGAQRHDAGGMDRGAVYVYQRPGGGWATTGVFSAKLTASDGADWDEFGESVAVSAGGGIVVAGAPFNNGSVVDSGAAYVYMRPGEDWNTGTPGSAKLTSNNITHGDEFGYAVAVSQDGATVVAGAPEHSPGGGALVYTRPHGGWQSANDETAKLGAVDGADKDKLGWAVAASGNGSTVIATAPWDDGSGSGQSRGAIYVYERPETGWVPAVAFGAKLTVWDGGADDALGWAAAISADGSTVVAGAPWQDAGGIDRGAVYVFLRPQSGWVTSSTYAARLTASDGADGDGLGWSVAVSGNGATVVAGAPYHDALGGDWGAAYVIERPPGGWPATASFTAKLSHTTSDMDKLGWSVAVSGDGSTVVAGVPYYHSSKPDGSELRDVGEACVYQRPPGKWSTTAVPSARLVDSSGSEFDFLGWSVAVNWDGELVAAGTPGREAGGTDRGAVNLYQRPAGGWPTITAPTTTLNAGSGGNGDVLGWWVSLSADADRVVAGAPNYNGPGTNCGAAYVYDRTGDGWPPLITTGARLMAGDCTVGDVLGWSLSVSSDGSTVVAGAPNHDTIGTERGAVYVFAMSIAPQFSSGPPPSPVPVGAPYAHDFRASGHPPPAFWLQSGNLPPGLTLDAESGLLAGTPSTPGTYDFVVEADNGVAPTATQWVQIEVTAVFRAYAPLVLR
jgi:hypothetical protein